MGELINHCSFGAGCPVFRQMHMLSFLAVFWVTSISTSLAFCMFVSSCYRFRFSRRTVTDTPPCSGRCGMEWPGRCNCYWGRPKGSQAVRWTKGDPGFSHDNVILQRARINPFVGMVPRIDFIRCRFAWKVWYTPVYDHSTSGKWGTNIQPSPNYHNFQRGKRVFCVKKNRCFKMFQDFE